MWPFKKKSDATTGKTAPKTLKADSVEGQIRELHLRLLDMEGDFDKVLTQLKRFGARLARRDEREPQPEPNGAEVNADSMPAPPQAPPAISFDRKSALRARARELRHR